MRFLMPKKTTHNVFLVEFEIQQVSNASSIIFEQPMLAGNTILSKECETFALICIHELFALRTSFVDSLGSNIWTGSVVV